MLDRARTQQATIISMTEATAVDRAFRALTTKLAADLTRGQHLVLWGPRGSGKTTLLNAVLQDLGSARCALAPVVGSGRRARLLVARPRDSCALGHEGMAAKTARRGGWRHACGRCRLAAGSGAAAGHEGRVYDLADAADRVAYALASSDSCVEFGTRIRVTDSGAADPRPRRPRPAWLDRTMRHTRSSTSVLACTAATSACTRPGHGDAPARSELDRTDKANQ